MKLYVKASHIATSNVVLMMTSQNLNFKLEFSESIIFIKLAIIMTVTETFLRIYNKQASGMDYVSSLVSLLSSFTIYCFKYFILSWRFIWSLLLAYRFMTLSFKTHIHKPLLTVFNGSCINDYDISLDYYKA